MAQFANEDEARAYLAQFKVPYIVYVTRKDRGDTVIYEDMIFMRERNGDLQIFKADLNGWGIKVNDDKDIRIVRQSEVLAQHLDDLKDLDFSKVNYKTINTTNVKGFRIHV